MNPLTQVTSTRLNPSESRGVLGGRKRRAKNGTQQRRRLLLETLEDRRVLAATFQIVDLTSNNAAIIDHDAITGDDRGGIAVSDSRVLITGDFATGSFAIDDLSDGSDVGTVFDGLVSDLATQTIYSLATDATTPIVRFSGVQNITHLIQHDSASGALTATAITLSTPIAVDTSTGGNGIFAGFGRVLVYNEAGVLEIDLTPGNVGNVTDLGALTALPHRTSENWAFWGVAEHVGGEDFLVFANGNGTEVSRTRVSDGATTTVSSFPLGLNDMASLTVSPQLNRWYFHHEGSSGTFGGSIETLGFSDATFFAGALLEGVPARVVSDAYDSVVIEFDVAIDPSTFNSDDIQLTRDGGANLIDESVTVSSLGGNRYSIDNLAPLSEAEGRYQLSVVGDAINDSSDNPLGLVQASQFWTIDTTLPVFSALQPIGSLIYQSQETRTLILPDGGQSLSFVADAGQTLSVAVAPEPGLAPMVTITDASGGVVANATAAVGETLRLQTVPLATAGEYTIRITAAGATTSTETADFTITATLNAVLEDEGVGGNDTPATAQSIESGFTKLFGRGERSAVSGDLELTTSTPLDSDNFESGSLDGQWSTNSSTAEGRIQVTGAFGTAGGGFALLMDNGADSGNEVLNEAIWTVDLSGATRPILDFFHASFDDEITPFAGNFAGSFDADGIAVSTDGMNWTPIFNAPDQPNGEWVRYQVDLLAAGLPLTTTYQIKFQQFDSNALTTDGRGWDEIRVVEAGEDVYSFDLAANESVTLALASTSPSSGAIVELLDPTGNLIDAGTAGPGSGEHRVTGVQVPTAGTYLARVTGLPTSYQLVATRSAVFDPEPNGSLAEAQNLSTTGVALGFLEQTQVFGSNAGGGQFLSVNAATGETTVIGSPSTDDLIEIELANDGTLYGASSFQLFTIDPQTGTGTLIGDSGGPYFALEFATDGTLFAVRDDRFGIVNTTDAAFTEISDPGLGRIGGLALQPDTGVLFGISSGNPSMLYTVDPATGVFTVVGDTGLPGATSLEFSADGQLFAGVGEQFDNALRGSLALIDPETATSQIIGRSASTGNLAGLAFTDEATDFYSIDVEAGQTITGNFRSLITGSADVAVPLDAQVTLVDPANAPLLNPDADGKFSFTATDAGTYVIEIRSNVLLGQPGDTGEYVLSVTAADPVTNFVPIGPSGSLVYDPPMNGDIGAAGEVDDYVLTVDPNQTITVTLTTDATLQGELEIIDGGGNVLSTITAANAGDSVFLQTISAASGGTFTVHVRGAGDTTGNYTIETILNAAIEEESLGGNTNDDQASAQDIDSSFITPAGGVEQRGAVRGIAQEATDDFFQFTAIAGDRISLSASGDVQIDLLNSAGQLISRGIATNLGEQVINQYVANANEMYFVVVSSAVDDAAYALVATRNVDLEAEQDAFDEQAQDIHDTGAVLGRLEFSFDFYSFEVNDGDTFTIETFTPGGGPLDPENLLDPAIELFAPDGTSLSTDDNSATDGVNATLTHNATVSGTYSVRVTTNFFFGAGGDYLLRVSSNTGTSGPVTVTSTSPADGQSVPAFPTTIDINFSEAIDVTTLTASDVLIGGLAATSVTQVDGDTFTFDVDPAAAAGDGPYAVELAAGAVNDLQGGSLVAYTGSFVLDTVAPKLTGLTFNGNSLDASGIIEPGPLTVVASFDEAIFDQDVFFPTNVLLRHVESGATIALIAGGTLNAASDELTYEFDSLIDGNYTLTLASGDGAFEDLAGNDLDGEPLGAGIDGTPSGDGTAGGDFEVSFIVDRSVATQVPLSRVQPLGSLIFRSPSTSSALHEATDTDDFNFDASAGQTLSAVLRPSDPTASLSVTFGGTKVTGNAGETVVLPLQTIDTTGLQTITVSGDSASAYTLEVTLNASLELFASGGDTSDGNELAINDSGLSLGSGTRYAVVGRVTPTLSINAGTTTPSTDQTFTGDNLDPGLTWDRPEEDGSALSGEIVQYHQQSFTVPVTGNYQILSVQDYDGFIHLYETTFDPTAQFTNLLAGNDDFSGNRQSRIDSVSLTAGTTYILVTSSFGAANTGTFTSTITGPFASYSGDNTAPSLIWNRPDDAGPNIATNGPVQYHVAALSVDTAGEFDILSSQDYDGYLHLYQGSFNPNQPLLGLIAGNNGTALSDVALEAGTTYFVVTSAFASGGVGMFTNSVVGNGAITVSPVDVEADVDEYTIDLTGRMGQSIDIVLADQNGQDISATMLELLDTDGATVLATATANPLGTTVSNFDFGILDFIVPADGVYTVRSTAIFGGDYSLVVTDSLSFDTEPNDDAAVDTLRDLTLNRAAVGLIIGEAVFFTADFSDAGNPSLDGFTIDPDAASQWHLSTGRGADMGHSGLDSLYFGMGEDAAGNGSYDTGARALGSVTSPPIDLTSALSAELTFNYLLEHEDGFDQASVQVSTDGGATFVTLVVDLDNTGGAFVAQTVDLNSFVGSTIQVRFNFDTNDEQFNNFEGWYLDDVVVGTAIAVVDTVDHYALDLTSGDQVTVTADALFDLATVTPGNSLDAKLTVIAPDGATVVATDSDTRDGKNPALTFTASTDGTYTIRVETEAGLGEYVLNASAAVFTPTITESNGSTDVDESGATDSLDVVLSSVPTANVTTTLTPDAQVDLGNGPGVPITLTFTPTTAFTPQTVTVTAVDDAVAESSPHTGTITVTQSSTDASFHAVANADVTVNITDNDFLTPVILSTATDPTNLPLIPITIDFGSVVTTFDATDLVVAGGTVGDFSDDGGGVFSFNVTPTTDGTVTVDVAAAAALDAGNKSTLVATQFTITSDRTAPTTTITGPSGPSNVEPFDVTITFSEIVTGFVAGDIAVVGGTVTNLVDNLDGTFTATIDATADGNVTVNVAAGVAADAAANANAAATPFAILIDTTAPTVVVNIVDPALGISDKVSSVTFTFSEATTDFTATDVTVTGGTLSALTGSGTSYTATFTANDDFAGTGSVTVTAGSYTDATGNVGATGTDTLAIDTIAPTVVVDIVATALNNADKVSSVTFTFSEATTDFTATDVTVTGGTLSALTGSGTSYTATFTANDDFAGTGSVTVTAGSYTDATGNVGATGADTVAIDTSVALPTVTLAVNNATIAEAAGVATVTATLSAAATQIVTVNLVVTGTATNTVDYTLSSNLITIPVGGTSGSVTITAIQDTFVEPNETVIVAIASVTNATGATPQQITTTILDDDTATAPTPVITGPSSPTNSDPFNITINFGSVVTGFELSDIAVTGGTASNLVDNGSGSFTATIDATASGTVTVNIAAGAAMSTGSVASLAANPLTVVVDTVGPAPTITGPASPTSSDPFNVTIAFSEIVIGFVAGDITVAGGSVTNLVDNSDGSFTATIDATADGAVTVDVAAGVTTDAAGNANTAATQFSVTVDTSVALPTVTLAVNNATIAEAAGVATVTATLSAAATQIVTVNLGVSGTATIGSDYTLSSNQITIPVGGTTGSVTITAIQDTFIELDETVIVAIASVTNATGATPQLITTTILDDDTATAPTPVITGPTSPTNSDPFNITVNFGTAVTGFELSDITVNGGTVSNLVDIGGGSFTATVDATADGTVTVNIAAGAAMNSGGTASLAATQFSVVVNTVAPIPVITGPTSPTNTDPFNITINFGSVVTGFELSDIAVTGGTASNLVDNGSGSFTATVDAAANGTVTVNIAAGAAMNAGSVASLAANPLTVVVDTVGPTPTITGPSSRTSLSPFELTITFGEAVTGFVASDITVTGGTVANLVAGTVAGSFTASITPTALGTTVISIAAAVVTDAAGNANLVAVPLSVTVSAPSTPVVNISPTGPNAEEDPDDLPSGTQPTMWSLQRSSLRELVIDLPTALTTVSASDIVLTNLGVNADMDADTVITLRDDQLTLAQGGMQLRITFDMGQLTDGVYQVRLLGGITGGGPFTLVGDATNKFGVLTGDWNGSGAVTSSDFATFAYWFGSGAGVAPSYVDINGSGAVTIGDFAGFAANFGKSIVFPGSSAPAAPGGEGELASAMQTMLNPPDVNGDGVVTAGDALEVLHEMSLGNTSVDGWSRHDVNRDGHISASDALNIINDLHVKSLGVFNSGEGENTVVVTDVLNEPAANAVPRAVDTFLASLESIEQKLIGGESPSAVVVAGGEFVDILVDDTETVTQTVDGLFSDESFLEDLIAR